MGLWKDAAKRGILVCGLGNELHTTPVQQGGVIFTVQPLVELAGINDHRHSLMVALHPFVRLCGHHGEVIALKNTGNKGQVGACPLEKVLAFDGPAGLGAGDFLGLVGFIEPQGGDDAAAVLERLGPHVLAQGHSLVAAGVVDGIVVPGHLKPPVHHLCLQPAMLRYQNGHHRIVIGICRLRGSHVDILLFLEVLLYGVDDAVELILGYENEPAAHSRTSAGFGSVYHKPGSE